MRKLLTTVSIVLAMATPALAEDMISTPLKLPLLVLPLAVPVVIPVPAD